MTAPGVETIRERTLAAVPEHSRIVAGPGTVEVPGSLVGDPAWVRAQVARRAQRWGLDPEADAVVVATLWWFSMSTVLVTPVLAALVATGWATSPDPVDHRLHLLPDGLPVSAYAIRGFDGAADDPAAVGAALRRGLDPAVAAVAAITGRSDRPLWALTTDAVAGALRWVGREVRADRATAVAAATALAAPITAAMAVPGARYVDVVGVGPDGADGTVGRYVHRVSCCLIYRVPGEALCASCPKRLAADRLTALRAALAAGY